MLANPSSISPGHFSALPSYPVCSVMDGGAEPPSCDDTYPSGKTIREQ
jgi:hypothetical protein